MTAKRTDIDIDDLVEKYLSGKSEKFLSEYFGIARTAIRTRLLSREVVPRNRSEAMFERMRQATPDEIFHLTEKAHDAVRGRKRSEREMYKSAIKKQATLSKIGNGETMLSEWLADFGLDPVLQRAIDRYNIDIAVAPVAVELLVSKANPFSRSNDTRKIKHLCDRNWAVVYVWVTKSHFLSRDAAKYIRSIFDLVKADPSQRGQYWVIRGSGELYSRGKP
jgi:hypothetical protein